MRILQICHRIPYPAVDGGNIAMMNMALALTEAGHEVRQFALNTNKHYRDPASLPQSLREKLNFHSAPINTGVRISGLVKSFFSGESYNIKRFYSESVSREIEKLLKAADYDIVQLETLYAAPYIACIRKNSKAKIVLRAHNVEHVIWKRLAGKATNPFRKWLLFFLASRLKKYEIGILRHVDALVPITPVDENYFREFKFDKPVLTLPISLNLNEYHFDTQSKPELCLFHLGSMDWMPNQEAVKWFLSNCWPDLHKDFPGLKLYLAGRGFPDNLIQEKYDNVSFDGSIADAHEYMSDKQIMIVPLLSGSGMRVKIIQGMALGKTIISTSIGAEGIPATHEKNILIGNSPEEIRSLVRRCINDPSFCRNIGIQARKFAEDHYSNKSVGYQLGIFYSALMKLPAHTK